MHKDLVIRFFCLLVSYEFSDEFRGLVRGLVHYNERYLMVTMVAFGTCA